MSKSTQSHHIITPDRLTGKPLEVPLEPTDAVTEAIDATLAIYRAVTLLELLDPTPDNALVEKAHWSLLLALESSGIKYDNVALELGYETAEQVEQELAAAQAARDKEADFRLDALLVSERYHGILRRSIQELAEQPESAPTKNTEKDNLVVKSPDELALNETELTILQAFRADQDGAQAELEVMYENVLLEYAEMFDKEIPDVLEIALTVLHDTARKIDFACLTEFSDILRANLESALMVKQRLHHVAEITSDLDMAAYYQELLSQGANMRRLKSSLSIETVKDVADAATRYSAERLAKGATKPITIFAELRDRAKYHHANVIKENFLSAVIKALKISVRLYDDGKQAFHIGELPTTKQAELYGTILEPITAEHVEKLLAKKVRRT